MSDDIVAELDSWLLQALIQIDEQLKEMDQKLDRLSELMDANRLKLDSCIKPRRSLMEWLG